MMLAFMSPDPNDCTYFRAIGPITDTEPASESPKPSRMDFLPSSMTSAGISSYLKLTANSATDFVRPDAFGNSGAAGRAAEDASTRRPVSANADTASEVLHKSRRFMVHVLIFSVEFNSLPHASTAQPSLRKFERCFPCRFFSALRRTVD